jgi:hypothetical protein
MEIIEFILSNPLVVAGLIFVLSSLFGKKEKEKKQRRQKEKRSSAESVPLPSNEKNDKQPVHHESMKEAIETIELRYHSAKKEISELGAHVGSGINENQLTNQIEAKSSDHKRQQKSAAINSENAVQGFIWSEILGPPRSKKPHSRTKR